MGSLLERIIFSWNITARLGVQERVYPKNHSFPVSRARAGAEFFWEKADFCRENKLVGAISSVLETACALQDHSRVLAFPFAADRLELHFLSIKK